MKDEIVIKIKEYELEEHFQAWEEIEEKTGLIPEEFLPWQLADKYERLRNLEAEKNAIYIVDRLKDILNNGDWIDRNWQRLARELGDQLEKRYG